ncbi:MAG: hypothetical protein ACLR4A_10900 [Christensenellales bacterium]
MPAAAIVNRFGSSTGVAVGDGLGVGPSVISGMGDAVGTPVGVAVASSV